MVDSGDPGGMTVHTGDPGGMTVDSSDLDEASIRMKLDSEQGKGISLFSVIPI